MKTNKKTRNKKAQNKNTQNKNIQKKKIDKRGLLYAVFANAFIALILEADLPIFSNIEFKGMFSLEIAILVSLVMLVCLLFLPRTRNFSYWLVGLLAAFIIATIAEWGGFLGGYLAGMIMTMLIYVYESFIYAAFVMFEITMKALKQAQKEKKKLSLEHIKRIGFPPMIFFNLLLALMLIMWFD